MLIRTHKHFHGIMPHLLRNHLPDTFTRHDVQKAGEAAGHDWDGAIYSGLTIALQRGSRKPNSGYRAEKVGRRWTFHKEK